LNILITGASGLIGTALQAALHQQGHKVTCMERGENCTSNFFWQPDKKIIHFDGTKHIDVVINLAGSNISDGRWTDKKKQLILDSRIKSTQLLSTTLAKLKSPPKLFISGSAIGFYGETGSGIVNENSNGGNDFLANISKQWEDATKSAIDAGIRTVNLRTGIVLSTKGGALQKMLLPFKLGLGGVVGSGKQYMSWVSIEDVTRIISFIIDNDTLVGPVNMVSPEPVTNYEFTKSLGQSLGRPTIFPMPAFVARLLFGEMADALLLTSIRVKPEKLIQQGYDFYHQNLSNALKDIIH